MSDDSSVWDTADRSRREREAGGDRWFGAHRDSFARAILRDEISDEDMRLYHAAIRARMAEGAMDRLRRRVLHEARSRNPNLPDEPKREAGERLLSLIRPVVLKPDAKQQDVQFYEAIVAADEFRLFVDSALRTVNDAARDAHERGLI